MVLGQRAGCCVDRLCADSALWRRCNRRTGTEFGAPLSGGIQMVVAMTANVASIVDVLMRMFVAAKKRIVVYFIFFFVVWPLMTIIFSVNSVLHLPYYSLSFFQAVAGVLGGGVLLAGDSLVAACLCLAGSLLLFSMLSVFGVLAESDSRQALAMELVLLLGSLVFAVVLFYPSVLAGSLFVPLQSLPVWAVLLLALLLVTVLSACRGRPGKRLVVGLCVLAAGFVLPGLTLVRNLSMPSLPASPPVVLLGLDSISLRDDVSYLRDWTSANGGEWHTNVVSPGLLTNAVWSSLVMQKPVREHGIFHTFQGVEDPKQCVLVHSAQEQGYFTAAFFSDQFTCWTGSDCRFDRDRSGPRGWRQMATALYANNSLLLPLVRPLLPIMPWSPGPPNQAGTFAYSLRRELNEIFTQSSDGGKTMVFGHSTYLHIPCYPSLFSLSDGELWRVLTAAVSRVQDRSFDWQDYVHPDDALLVRQWKVRHLQETVAGVIEQTGFLEQGGKLVLFSDHGDRLGLGQQTFKESRFWNVLFATFNLPAYEHVKPVSLIDCGAILGLTTSQPFAPIVEYAMGNSAEWQALGQTAVVGWDGSVNLDKAILASIVQRLDSCRPLLPPAARE